MGFKYTTLVEICRQAILRLSTSIGFIVLCQLPVAAQGTVSGKVINQADKKAVSHASAFLSNATIGTETDDKGNFVLLNVKPGKYEIVISIVGFQTYHQPVTINNSPVDLGVIEVSPKPIILKEVRIRSGNNAAWLRNYQWFKDGFLGTTALANACKIINPEALDFNYKALTDTLTASTDDFLIIENNALGYRMKYLVEHFIRCDSGRKINYEGAVLFENMKGTSSQEKRWLKKRREVYEGSAMHFLRSAIADRLDDEGFRVFQYAVYANPARKPDSLIKAKISRFTKTIRSKNSIYRDSLSFWKNQLGLPKILHSLMHFPLNGSEFTGRTDQPGIYALGCENDGLYIIYNKDRHFPKNAGMGFLTNPDNNSDTLIGFNSSFVFFDGNGWVTDPESLSLTGAWTRNRVVGMLPTDYMPYQ